MDSRFRGNDGCGGGHGPTYQRSNVAGSHETRVKMNSSPFLVVLGTLYSNRFYILQRSNS